MSDQQPGTGASTPAASSLINPNPTNSRFAPQNKTVQERVSDSTVGLVNLADFRKRRAGVLEQQHREVREAAIAAARGTTTTTGLDTTTDTSAAATPLDRSETGTPAPGTDAENGAATGGEGKSSEGESKKKKKTATTGGERKAKRIKTKKALVSFGDEEEEGEEETVVVKKKAGTKKEETKTDGESEQNKETGVTTASTATNRESSTDASDAPKKKIVNTSAPIIPRALTKAALRREAAEREAIRKEFLAKQAAVKASEIAIPFVFYDGTNIPGGMVRVKKGDHAWLFLDKSRKVGAERGVGQDKILNARRAWARVSVDDLLLVRGSIIIPHVSTTLFFSFLHGNASQ